MSHVMGMIAKQFSLETVVGFVRFELTSGVAGDNIKRSRNEGMLSCQRCLTKLLLKNCEVDSLAER